MRRRQWRLRLEDILEAVTSIQEFTRDMTLESFKTDKRTVDAVVRNVEVIGEAARHLPQEIERRYPDIPWSRVRAMRNVMAHEYFGISTTIMWQTIQDDLPALKATVQRMLAAES